MSEATYPAESRTRVLADTAIAVPRLGARTRDATLVLGAALFTAICAQISFPLPGSPVPITGQTFAVLLCGAALGSRRGAASMLLYMGLGMVGMPVYSDGSSGVSVVWGATGGYIVGFAFAAYLVGRMAEMRFDRTPWKALPQFVVGTLIVFSFGVPWLAVAAGVGLGEAVSLGLTPFIPGAIVKAVAAAGLLPTAWRLVGRVEGRDPGR